VFAASIKERAKGRKEKGGRGMRKERLEAGKTEELSLNLNM